MKSYWVWLVLNVVVWPFAIGYTDLTINQLTGQLFGVALYFAIFFLIPLVKKRPSLFVFFICLNVIIAMITLFPSDGTINPFLILILSLLIAEGFYHLTIGNSLIISVIGCGAILITVLNSNLGQIIEIFVEIYIIFLLIGLLVYKQTKDQWTDLDARYQALFSEYRDIKRRAVSEEELARQEERVLIAHEIHDSVGHKLTALIMQLEMFRLQTSEEYKEKVQSLKELAGESLNETRRAVKSLKANDTGGLSGILRLIRKLEMENMIRIHFSVKHGAFSAPLTGEQSFVIYRSVQEALTNIMKHSNAKEAEIMFEAQGNSIFRFEISNPISNRSLYKEGFGLSSMRERLEKYGGDLKVIKTDEQFRISGFIKLLNIGDEHGSNITG